MLNQSKTAHQAEIDAACEVIDFWRFNVEFMLRIYEEQPVSSPGVWNRMEYRPLEGFVFAISPFNFTAIGANLSTSPALMGDTVLWKPASTAALSAYWTMKLFEEAGLPPGVDQLRVRQRRRRRRPRARRASTSPAIHFTGSTEVFHSIWKTVGENIDRYRNYPRIVGETGGKDFIVAHPSADVDALATAILRGSFEYQGQKCSAASRVYAPSNLWPELRERLVEEVGTIKMGDVSDFSNFMGAVIDGKLVRPPARGDRARQGRPDAEVIAGGGTDDSEGYFVEPTVIQTKDPRDRLMREEFFGPIVTTYVYPEDDWEADAGARGRDGAVRAHRRDLRPGPRGDRRGPGGAPVRGRQLLRQRQADRRGRRAAAVRRLARLGHERQGRLDVEPDPLGQPADDQGDVRPAARLPLPVPGRGGVRRRAGQLRQALKRPLLIALAFLLVSPPWRPRPGSAARPAPTACRRVNGVRDTVTCGRGHDLATVDGLDRVGVRLRGGHAPDLARPVREPRRAQHETEVEPDSFAHGKTVVTVFQVGRVFSGGARNIGFAVSRDSGRTWKHGFLQRPRAEARAIRRSPTTAGTASGSRSRSSSAQGGSSIRVSRSAERLALERAGDRGRHQRRTFGQDKEWIACDNWPQSPLLRQLLPQLQRHDRRAGRRSDVRPTAA